MKISTLLVLCAMAQMALLGSGVAQADPERAYQAGKQLSGKFEGKNKVDDRDAGRRAADYLRDKGAGNKDSNSLKYDPNYNDPAASRRK